MPEVTQKPGHATGSDEDFAALFEQSLKSPKTGDVVSGRVVRIGPDIVTIDIGYKSEGQVPRHEFTTRDGELTVSEGDTVDVYFESTDTESGEIMLSRQKALQFKVWHDIEQAYESQGVVEGTIVGKVKGGLKVDIGVAAFLPGSHADLRPARNLDRYIGQRGRFAILKFNRSRGNVVVSRRAVLERERTALKEETLKVLEEGIILEGTVKNITDYGAFVGAGRGAQVRPRARACVARHEADHAGSVVHREREVPHRHAHPGEGREPHGLRCVRGAGEGA
jgi:small subunit ribosomal protein S1